MKQLTLIVLALLMAAVIGVYVFATMVFIVTVLAITLVIAVPCFWLHDLSAKNKPSRRHFSG